MKEKEKTKERKNEKMKTFKEFLWEKVDVAEIIFQAFCEKSKEDDELSKIEIQLNKSLKEEDLKLFRQFEFRIAKVMVEEKRELVKFVLDFIKECKI